jgi:hypothetical protein
MLKVGDYVRIKSWRDNYNGEIPIFGKVLSFYYDKDGLGKRFVVYHIETINKKSIITASNEYSVLSEDIVKVKYKDILASLV